MTVAPNPARQGARITLVLPSGVSRLEVAVYDLHGRRVRSLWSDAGPSSTTFRVVWDGRSDRNIRVAAGVYFIRAAAGSLIALRRVVVVE
jgi:hypothetical protein